MKPREGSIMMIKMVDTDRWFDIFRFFESRKALRFYGGRKGVDKASPILSLLTLTLWLIVFGLANVVVSKDSLTLVFQDIREVSNVTIAFFIGNVGLNIISLVIILISVFFGIGKIIIIQFLVMLSSAIVVLSLKSQSTNIEEASLQLAILIVTYVTSSLLADVLLYYMWVGFLLGPLFRWMKHSDNIFASSVFPYPQVVAFGLLVLLIIPLWIPVLASYFLVLLLQVVGVRIVNRSVLEFLILDKGSYETFECVSVEQTTSPNIYRLDFDYRLKEIVSWRFWQCNRLPTSHFTYEGELDGDGIPSGVGTWTDIEYGGEILSGCWSGGRPMAPYQSQEQRPNGGAFSANSLLFVNLGNLHRVGFSTEFRGPQYGIASVECGRSGTFYAGFPEARLELLPSFESILSASLAGKPLSHVNIVIYICGYNNSCEGACKMLAQMLGLSSYPAHILPIVFAWPGGNIPRFFSAKAVCESQRLRDEFSDLVGRLWASGQVTSIDVIAHSQGCRFLTHSFSKPEMQSLDIRHMVLISPEADLQDFEIDGDAILGNIRGFVTLYAHPHDTALFWAQIFNSMFAHDGNFRSSLGRRSDPIVSRESGESLDMDIINTSSLASNVEELHHSFFYLSREMLWDIQSLLVDGCRARDRPLLIQRGENSRCYHFCSVPSSMTTIF